MPPETRSAAEAFEALRLEVAETRSELRRLATTIARKPEHDWALTLGQMSAQLAGLELALQAIDRKSYRAPIRMPGEAGTPEHLAEVATDLSALGGRLKAALDIRAQQRAGRRLIAAVIVGVVLGLASCLGVAALLPRQAGIWVATSIIGNDPWTVGQTIMRQADPVSFSRMIRLYNACPADVSAELCAAQITVGAAAAGDRGSGTRR
jgi:hypothetical protein